MILFTHWTKSLKLEFGWKIKIRNNLARKSKWYCVPNISIIFGIEIQSFSDKITFTMNFNWFGRQFREWWKSLEVSLKSEFFFNFQFFMSQCKNFNWLQPFFNALLLCLKNDLEEKELRSMTWKPLRRWFWRISIAWKNQVNNNIYQCLQVYQVVNMMRNFLIFLTFSAVFSLPIEENIEPKEAKEAEKKIEDDEAARNARFNFGYSIQVSHNFLKIPQKVYLTVAIFGAKIQIL